VLLTTLLALVVAAAIGRPLVVVVAAQEPAVEQPSEASAAEAHGAESEHGWMETAAKAVNFALLAGVLVYFLKGPTVQYLTGRRDTIRRDLIEAQTLRETAQAELTRVRAELAALPAELDALRARGREELALEQARMKDAAAREREQVLARTRSGIELTARLARRELVEYTADLATRLARTRIEHTMTPDDQERLLDRYTAGVRA
jgi:F-type H+-transporting ATPase subunit b